MSTAQDDAPMSEGLVRMILKTAGFNNPDEVRDALLNILGTDTVNEAFDILDDDQSGTIGIDEFIDSITKVCNSHVDIEMVRLTREFALQKKQVKDVQDVCCNTFDLIRGIQSHLLEHQALAAHNALSAL